MARAIWTGSVSFGLVNIPVRLFSATESRQISFHQVDRESGRRIRYRRVAEETEEEVPYEQIVKGYDLGDGRFVTLAREELDALEPTKTRTIQIEDFVSLAEIDPIFWNKTYYLGPAGPGAHKPYALLRDAMEESGRVAIARFVLRSKEHLATVRPIGGVLGLETMYFADEIRRSEEVEDAPKEVEVSAKELALAQQLIDALTTRWEPERYRDTYRDRVTALIEQKAEGAEVRVEAVRGEGPKVLDLMQALKASLAGKGDGERRDGEDRGDRAAREDGARGGGAAKDELAGLTKTELYERAAQAEVPGRSKMSREELLEALRKAG